ncbi:MAG: glycosyltransferase family 2 protein [Lachnospiraceae bacterium]|nr:glycosyltransferase family 2 protein [Lachnospiraceae bacterium]
MGMEQRRERENANIFVKTIRYLRKNGLKKCVYKIYRKLFRLEKIGYEKWRRETAISGAELERQKNFVFPVMPKISLAVPLYRTPEAYLRDMIVSLLSQTYGNWELCLADGSGEEGALEALVRKFGRGDVRIRYRKLEKNEGIAGNTNRALAMASGEWIGLLDHDDTLAPQALFEVVRCLNNDPRAELIYTDEDKTDGEGKRYREPHFKPDFNPDLLRTVNYICHFTVVKKDLLERTGGFREGYDGAQDYDLILRCCEQAERVCHIPKILYHWRCHENSTSANPESKRYAFEAGRRALLSHYERVGLKAEVFDGVSPGIYHSRFAFSGEPLVSILIPNKDHAEDLKVCVRSILDRSDYRNFEILILENNSCQAETFACYEELKREEKVRVIAWNHPFNYSAVNNFGAKEAKGEYFLLLNNDTEMINPEALREMLGYCAREDVGVVGAKLFFGDDTIQHAGIVLGIGGVAGHAFAGQPRTDYGYMSRAWCTQDYSAVTGACLMVKRSVFEAVHGLNEDLAYAFNDVDFCLRVRELGYLVVYNSEALLYHYESKSRGREDTPEKIARFHRETAYCLKRWGKILKEGDPYYNPNLTLEWQDFSCKSRSERRKMQMDREDFGRAMEKMGREK